jgi:hypothetical protein
MSTSSSSTEGSRKRARLDTRRSPHTSARCPVAKSYPARPMRRQPSHTRPSDLMTLPFPLSRYGEFSDPVVRPATPEVPLMTSEVTGARI